MTSDNSKDPETREAAIKMLREGTATPSEVGRLAGVSRQLVNYWIDAEKLDPKRRRDSRLSHEWRRLMGKKKR